MKAEKPAGVICAGVAISEPGGRPGFAPESVAEQLTRPLAGAEIVRIAFSLDCWLQSRALSNQPKGFTAVLVVHEDGRGIGTGLVKHALQRCVTAAKLVGGRALLVNAVDLDVAAFWQRRGFLPSRDDPLILVRSIADIAASLASGETSAS